MPDPIAQYSNPNSAVSDLPVWQVFLWPELEVLLSGQTRSRRALGSEVISYMNLSQAQLEEQVSTGGNRAVGRFGWALSDLVRAELVDRPARATYRISDAGRAFLDAHIGPITDVDLKQIPAYQAYVPAGGDRPQRSELAETHVAPLEQISDVKGRLDDEVKTDLLKRVRDQSPDFLETAVLKLLVAMGYGGAEQKATRLGGSGDGEVDGVIDQDALGLDQIYVLAKRYGEGNSVGRPEVQAFVGALHGMGASRGIFITTSTFTTGAVEYARTIGTRVILIDGARLSALMVKYGVGVQSKHVSRSSRSMRTSSSDLDAL